MSRFLLRRYRADRLLREEFETLREGVIATVEGRLRGAGVPLDRSDLEAAYAQAWHGLHAAVLEGREIVNPAGWLAVVAHRRALDEHRARRGAVPAALGGAGGRSASATGERDLADELDDRARLRALLEALRARLSERERQAAALCYLQGFSRADAAAQMGVSESRMRKLMDGAGNGLRGVAAKVGTLAQTIAGGKWCEEQGSMMRGLAFGILDPQGDRYRLALSHSDACPACRAYVLSLRGLAAVLPPVPVLLHRILGAGAGASAGTLAASGSAGAGVGGTAGATSAPLGPSIGAGALSASGAAGGGWWLAGGVGAKLAASCLLALGVGAGCVALDGRSHGTAARGRHIGHAGASPSAHATAKAMALAPSVGAAEARRSAAAEASVARPSGQETAAARASREFGPERPLASSPRDRTRMHAGQPTASTASERTAPGDATQRPDAEVAATTGGGSMAHTAAAAPAPSTPAAAREFAPG